MIGDEAPAGEDKDPIRKRHRLIDVVRNENDGGPVPPPEIEKEALHPKPGKRVQRAERFIQKKECRLSD